MRKSIIFTAAAAALLVGAAAGTVHAFDATGHWVGKWSCRGFDTEFGKFTSKNVASTLAITQTGNTLAANLDGGGFFYNGGALPDPKKPNEKGEVVLIDCETDNVPLAGNEGEMVRGSVKTKLDTFKASFKATSIFESAFPDTGTCKYSFKRIDTIDPGVAACAP